LVSLTRYPPLGRRSFGALRASRYGASQAEYFRSANDRVVIVLILETAEALEDVEAIAQVSGVNGLYIGQMDLALSLGVDPLGSDRSVVDRAVVEVIGKARNAGVVVGC